MPGGKKDYFYNGKYGLLAVNDWFTVLFQTEYAMLGWFDPVLQEELNQISLKVYSNLTEESLNEEGPAKRDFKGAIKNQQIAKEIEEDIKKIQTKVRNLMKNPTDEMRKEMGWFFLFDKLMDTESGDYGRMVAENPYLGYFLSMLANGQKVNNLISLQNSVKYLSETNPVTKEKEKGPLQAYSNFFYITSRLIQREYEKQEIDRNYSAEKEDAYLKRLKEDFKAIISNHKNFDRLVREDGTSDYDAYMENPLDMMTQKGITHFDSDRGIQGRIENIKGQQKAIDNGWRMNELNFCGQIPQLLFDFRRVRRKLEVPLSEANLNAERSVIQENINRFQNNPEALAEWQGQLEVSRKREKENREKLAKIIEIEEQLKKLNDELQKTNVSDKPLTKLDFCERYEKLANESIKALQSETFRNDPGIREFVKDFKSGLMYSKDAMEFGGMKRSPVVIPDEIKNTSISDELYDFYGPFYGLQGSFGGWISVWQPSISIYGENVFQDYIGAQKDKYHSDITGMLLEHHKYGSNRAEDSGIVVKYDIGKRESDIGKEAMNVSHAVMDDVLLSMKGPRKEMKRSYTAISVINDFEKGNFAKASGEDAYVMNLQSQLTAGVPNIYSLVEPPENVIKWMKEKEVLEAYNAFSDAGKERFQIEYEKQRMQKTGWDEKKEKIYLAKLEENINKTEKAMEKLVVLPLKTQVKDGMFGNTLSHVTGNDSDTGLHRDLLPYYEGTRWMREGIRQGWNSNDLKVLVLAGAMEGKIRVEKLKLQNSIENYKKDIKNNIGNADEKKENIREYQILIKKYTDFEEKQLKPFKQAVLGRKIESPADTIITVNRILDFYNKYKDADGFSRLFGRTIDNGIEKMIPDIINRNLKEIEDRKKEGAKPRPERKFVYCDRSRDLKQILDSVRGSENTDKDSLKMKAQIYLLNRYLHGKNETAHPELFDPKHPDYKASTKSLAKFAGQYADRLVTILNPSSSGQFADALEFGNHEDMFAEMRDRIAADASKERYGAFIKGKPSNKTRDKSIADAKKAMSEATAYLFSGSDLYDEIEKGLEELDKMKNDLVKDLQEKEKIDHSVRIVGYETDDDGNELKDRPIYEIKPSADMKLSDEQYRQYIDKQKTVFNKINRYLKGKDDLIREKGGNPENKQSISLLGTNGEKRYKAVQDAKKAVLNLNDVTTEFVQNGYSYSERRLVREPLKLSLQPSDYLENGKEYSKKESELLRKQYIRNEKALFEENLKYNLIAKIKETNVILEEEAKEKEESERLYKGVKKFLKPINPKNPETKELYLAKRQKAIMSLTDSAERTLFVEHVKELTEQKKKELFRSILRQDLKEANEWFSIREKYEKAAKTCEKYRTEKEKFDNELKKYNELLKKYSQIGIEPSKKMVREFKERELLFREIEEQYKKANSIVQKLQNEYNEKKPAYDDFMKQHEALSRDVEEGYYPKDLVARIKYEDLLEVQKELETALKASLPNPQFEEFKQNMDKNFKREFEDRIILAAVVMKQPVNKEEILKIREEIKNGVGVKVPVAEAPNKAPGQEVPNAGGGNNPEAPEPKGPKAAGPAMH